MAQTPSKIHFPTGGDNWDPAGDMEALARSVAHIVPVANAAERNAVLSEYNPSPSKPLFVNRGDTGAIERNDGSGWTTIYPTTAVAGFRTQPELRTVGNDIVLGHNLGGPARYSGGASAATNGILVPVAGWYSISAAVRWGSIGGGGYRQTRITINDNVAVMANELASANQVQNPSITAYLEAGSAIRLQVWQNSGAAVQTSPNFGMPFLSAALLGR